jgi:hypothetical protein
MCRLVTLKPLSERRKEEMELPLLAVLWPSLRRRVLLRIVSALSTPPRLLVLVLLVLVLLVLVQVVQEQLPR